MLFRIRDRGWAEESLPGRRAGTTSPQPRKGTFSVAPRDGISKGGEWRPIYARASQQTAQTQLLRYIS